MKKLLYLSDLYNFYVTQNKNVKFSSKDDDTTIVVHLDEPFKYSKSEENDLLMYTPIRLCHTLTNKNKSHIPEKAMKDAMSSAYNMPILGYIYQDDNDDFQFAGHEFFVNADNEIEYEEQPCGTIPESAGLKLVKYEGDDRSYLEGTGIIWRTYSKASDIIEREKELSVSVELVVDELSFDSKTKELVIDKFRFSGVTILGKDRNTGDDIMPGMENSMISISDFSETNNSIFSQNERVIEMLSALNEKIDNLNIEKISKEGGNQDVKKEFEEKSEEEIKNSPSAEVFDDNAGDGGDPSDPENVDYYDDPGNAEGGNDGEGGDTPAGNDTPSENEPSGNEPSGNDDSGNNSGGTSNNDNSGNVGDDSGDDSGDDDSDDDEGGLSIPLGQRDDDDTAGSSKKKYSVSINDGEKTLDFSVSLQDKIEAIYTLVNDTYSEADGCYYDCTVYDEEKYVIMSSWWTGDAYKQSFKVKKGVYTLVGDRVPVKAIWCTEDEEKALDNMRANYSSIESELASYKAEPEKEEILAKECYAQIAELDAFKELAKKENHFSMSVDEVSAEADRILLEYAKSGNKLEFSAKESEKKTVGVKKFANPSNKSSKGTGRYGGIFKK